MNDASISTRKSMSTLNREDTSSLPHVRESGIQQFFAVGIRNPEDWSPESTMVWNPESTMVWNLESTMVWIPESRKLESRGRDPESRTFVDSLTWGKALVYKLLCLGLPGSIAHFFLYLCLCLCQTCELALWTKFAARTSLFFFIQEHVTGVHTQGTMYGCLKT